MPADTIPQLSLGTAILVIFAVCTGFVMLRGITRMILGTLTLALSAWIGFLAWQHAPSLSFDWFGKSIGAVTTGLPIVAFVVSFLLIRRLAKLLSGPFLSSDAGGKKSGSVILRLVFALIPTSLICLIGAAVVHHTGSIAEVRAYSAGPGTDGKAAPAGYVQNLKSSIEKILPAAWLRFLDPLAEPSRLALAKWITATSDSPLKPVIDPRTGKPIPRAIIVEESELQNLAREGKFGTLLRHPLLTKALNDPKLKALLKELHL